MSVSCDLEPQKVNEVLLQHLRDNNVLREGPQAWTIGYSPLGGRGMFATRDIQQGELIFVDVPLLIGPRCGSKHVPMCCCCYKNDCPLFPCDHGCGLPVCSTECENSEKHVKYECQYLRSLVPNCGTDWSMDLLLAVVPIRALFMTDEQRRCLAALQCHRGLLHDYEVNLLRRNVENAPKEEDVNWMIHVCGVFNTNSFETVSVRDKDHSTSLRGLYPMGALQNHCCVPKTRHHFDAENRLYVSAALPIAAGEEITMLYTNFFWDTTLRRQFLSITKHFLCNCERCSDPTEFGSKLGAIFCASDTCSGSLLPQNPLKSESLWSCDTCRMAINYRQICSIRSGLAAIVEEALFKSPRKILRFIQKELSPLLPASNYLMMEMKFRIVSYLGRSENLDWPDLTDAELAIKSNYCKDLLSVLETLTSGDCQKRGLILYELYCTNVEGMKRLRQAQNIDKKQLRTFSEVTSDKNKRILEEALNILQDDVLAVTLLEDDRRRHIIEDNKI